MTEELPTTMIGIAISEPGGPEVLKPVTRPMPGPGPGEVLVAVAAAGVNRPDVVQRLGGYPPPPGASDLPGLELAGTIVALGPNTARWAIGDQVCALVGGGGYASHAVADGGACLPIPKGLSLAEAAALPETTFTVWSNLFDRGAADEGDWALVHGGSSGIGTTAIQLAKAFGVRTIVTAGSDAKCQACLDLGADIAVNYKAEDFAKRALEVTGGAGVDVVLDMVGGDYVPRNLSCLAEAGRHVSIAVQRGTTAEINLFAMMRKRWVLTGSTLRARDKSFKSALAQSVEHFVWPLIEAGQFRPVMDSSFALLDAWKAHARMDAGDHIGKIVLKV
jgi:NADPH:quinone reductase